MFWIGLVAALVASALFNVGIALQGIEARSTPKQLGLRVSLLTLLFRRKRWVVGWVLGVVGIAPQVVAFGNAPFVVVQPALASGLLILLFIGSRMFGEHVDWVEILGVSAIIDGVALVAWGAPQHVEAHRGAVALIAVAGALTAAGFFPFAVRGARWDTGMGSILASGAGFAASNVATKLLSDDVGRGHYAVAAMWAVVGLISGIAATITGMTAFQRRRATTVVPVSTAVQTFLPIILEPFFLREHWTSADYGGAPIGIGLLIALAGTIIVSRTRAVSELSAATQR
jgi:drug/metabolite transporter (DMT)-like permease